MKCIIITQDEAFFTPVYIQRILEKRKASVAAVFALPSAPSFFQMISYNFSFFHPWVFFRIGVRFVWFKFLNILSCIFPLSRPFSVQRVASLYGVPYHFVSHINHPATLALLKSYEPDFCLSIACPQKFKKEILSLPKFGCFNIHSALLPKHKGLNASFWALLEGDEKTGVTLHKMDEKLDNGEIAVQKEIIIEKTDTVMKLYAKAVATGSAAVNEFLEIMEKTQGKVPLKKMEGEGSYHSYPTKEDMKELYRRGRRYI